VGPPPTLTAQLTAVRAWRAAGWQAALSAALLAPLPAVAAPLDVWLSAEPVAGTARVAVEAAADHANRSLDPFRGNTGGAGTDPSVVATRPGSYRGSHLAGSVRLRDGLWLSGGVWQRRLDDGVDVYNYDSWLASAQWRLLEADASSGRPAVAVRLAAWGSAAQSVETTTAVAVPGAVLNSVKIIEPSDRQWQADVIARWTLSPSLDLGAHLGAGTLRLRYGDLEATTTRNGCDYDLQFQGNDIFGSLARPCSAAGGVIQQFYDRSGDYGVDVPREIAWRGHFLQAGVNATWRSGRWTVAGGALFHSQRRDDVDDIVAGRGNGFYRHQFSLGLDASARVHEHLSVFLRGQRSTHLFFNDLPVTYNSSTAASFGQHFSMLTLGLRADF
jgi:hypothetical protein